MCFLFLTQAAVRPFVVMKSIDWEVRRSRARSAAMPAHGGRELEAVAGEAGTQGTSRFRGPLSFTASVDGCPPQD
jgi:hypothetical protein